MERGRGRRRISIPVQQKSTRIDGWIDVVQAIDTAAPTNNEGNKDNISPVNFVDDEEVEMETKRPMII